MRNQLKYITLGLLLSVLSFAASAGIISFNSRDLFNRQGDIHFNSNFDDFAEGFNYPGTPFSLGDITYLSEENLTIGRGTQYSIGNSQTVLSNEYFSPIKGEIASLTHYTLFGFDAALTHGLASIVLETNLSRYTFADLSLPDGNDGLGFNGFKTNQAGEYFTGFSFAALEYHALAGISNVALGTVSPVPEPENMALLLIGITAFIARRASKKAST
ncbi:PEP-CTERM sorting domain-containing protein [Iodobacter sp. HSC-16F04]|uniref:PEP-CTERM sorting domain-containing protein n=1 Tax=Iodobacter violaceini TaxID=3044271 RepID=A0ABX0KUZ6_9NEIS|nr:PEP-CTERM sorting domain-containing protein [Iodobacter violacea]NHQ87624.1 PEP-CTERM sorting domain-containing protein [Iodobacter violacea]